MWHWLSSNLVTVIAALCVLVLVADAVAVLVKGKKQGCGDQCSGCPMCGSCHRTDTQ